MASLSVTQPVQFGISLPNRAVLFGLSPHVLLETAEHADASGFFDSVWVGDNHLEAASRVDRDPVGARPPGRAASGSGKSASRASRCGTR